MTQLHNGTTKYDGSTKSSWHNFTCGHCGRNVSGALIASFDNDYVRWLLCPGCEKGSVYNSGVMHPGIMFGPKLEGLPVIVEKAYNESRSCMSVNAFCAAELLCRKLLMHVAADKGAKEGDTFANYLTYLEEQGFITPPMKKWVDIIRQHGNKSTHLLDSPDQDRAKSTVMLTAELLRVVYEMEYMAKKYAKPVTP